MIFVIYKTYHIVFIATFMAGAQRFACSLGYMRALTIPPPIVSGYTALNNKAGKTTKDVRGLRGPRGPPGAVGALKSRAHSTSWLHDDADFFFFQSESSPGKQKKIIDKKK